MYIKLNKINTQNGGKKSLSQQFESTTTVLNEFILHRIYISEFDPRIQLNENGNKKSNGNK